MTPMMLYLVVALLGAVALGGSVFAFAGAGGDKAKKRMAAVARSTSPSARVAKGAADANQQRRKNVQIMLKELEKQQKAKKDRPTLRRRLERAGFDVEPRVYWIGSAMTGLLAAGGIVMAGQGWIVALLAGFAAGFGLPRWLLSFLTGRREKAFTREFASAIDVIVRSVKTGLPVGEALKVVASEIPEPVASEFKILTEGLKVGVTLEEGLKRMFERMPTAEVNFFGIVMTIQQKTGGNLSEALSNLSGVLRDRKRLEGKIKAMSSEAKASAMIIGSLPPGVAMMVYISTPEYITTLFVTDLGRLMLLGCAVWMSAGVFVMKRMVSFKY